MRVKISSLPTAGVTMGNGVRDHWWQQMCLVLAYTFSDDVRFLFIRLTSQNAWWTLILAFALIGLWLPFVALVTSLKPSSLCCYQRDEFQLPNAAPSSISSHTAKAMITADLSDTEEKEQERGWDKNESISPLSLQWRAPDWLQSFFLQPRKTSRVLKVVLLNTLIFPGVSSMTRMKPVPEQTHCSTCHCVLCLAWIFIHIFILGLR